MPLLLPRCVPWRHVYTTASALVAVLVPLLQSFLSILCAMKWGTFLFFVSDVGAGPPNARPVHLEHLHTSYEHGMLRSHHQVQSRRHCSAACAWSAGKPFSVVMSVRLWALLRPGTKPAVSAWCPAMQAGWVFVMTVFVIMAVPETKVGLIRHACMHDTPAALL